MKRIIISIILLIVLICSCNKEENNHIPVTGFLSDHTGCKNIIRGEKDSAYSTNESCIKYSFDAGLNKLLIKHINAGFNCCPDSLYCTVSFKNDTICIEEFEKAALCRCNCLYDLDVELDGILSKKYYIKIQFPR